MNLVTCAGKYNYVSILLLSRYTKMLKPNKPLINDLQTLVDQYICEIIHFSTICYTWKAMLSIWNCNTHCQKTTSNICCSTTQVLTMCSGMKEINFRIIPIHIYSVLCILKLLPRNEYSLASLTPSYLILMRTSFSSPSLSMFINVIPFRSYLNIWIKLGNVRFIHEWIAFDKGWCLYWYSTLFFLSQ